jgi:sugar porter (SP) family MFS transporter
MGSLGNSLEIEKSLSRLALEPDGQGLRKKKSPEDPEVGGEDVEFVGSRATQLLASVAANMGAMAFGSVMSWTATALPDLRADPVFAGITEDEESWIGSVVPLGAVLAGPIAGFGVERFGRKRSMLIFCLPFILGWLLIYTAQDIDSILIGRILTGISGGAFAIAAPIFVAEIADADIRGTLAAGFELMITVGMLFIFTAGTFLTWRMQALICGTIPMMIIFLLFFVHESPRYLIGRGKMAQAVNALCWYRGATNPKQVEGELAKLIEGDEENGGTEFSSMRSATILDLIRFPTYKPVLLVLMLFILQELSGIDAVTFYTVDIFQSAGVTLDSYYSTIILGVVQMVASLIAALLVDKSGRRFFLITSEIAMVISLGAFGIFFYVKSIDETFAIAYLQWVPLVSLLMYVVAYSIGVGPITYMILGEIMPQHVKGLASSILTAIKWMLGFTVTRFFLDLMDLVGKACGYWIFMGICLFGAIYIYIFVPETKGKTLEEIQTDFAGGRKRSDVEREPLIQGKEPQPQYDSRRTSSTFTKSNDTDRSI